MCKGRKKVGVCFLAWVSAHERLPLARRHSKEHRPCLEQGSRVQNKVLSEHLFDLKCCIFWFVVWNLHLIKDE